MEAKRLGSATADAFPSQDDIKSMVAEKAKELFMVCDVEQKGFVTKRDMQRLVEELPLMPDQLEEVFDSLDDDKNGYLTLEEFTDGFGGFLGLNHASAAQEEVDDGEYTHDHDDDGMEREFSLAMEGIGASGVIAEHDAVKELWKKLHQDEPGLLSDFEDFIQHVCSDIRTAQLNTGELENVMKSRDNSHQEDIKNLYEEMERQIRMEKERIISEEKEKERKIREQLESDMLSKDEQLQALLNRQAELERKLTELSMKESEFKDENESLLEQNENLSEKLDVTQSELQESKSYLKEIQEKIRKEKRERMQNNVRVSRGIMQERESLYAQLETLKMMNQALQDDKDIRVHRSMSDPDNTGEKKAKALVKQGSIMSNYFEEGTIGDGSSSRSSSIDAGRPGRRSSRKSITSIHSNHSNHRHGSIVEDDDECEVDDDFLVSSGLLTTVDDGAGMDVVYEEVEGDLLY